MNNSKRNIHNSGPLGMLVNSGQIRKVDTIDSPNDTLALAKDSLAEMDDVSKTHNTRRKAKASRSYFRTQSGIEFSENELVYLEPRECEPWQYANRLDTEMGDIAELMVSIKENNQLQPAMVRPHPKPHDGIKYEIIFGRRRHAACLELGIPFMAIKKDLANIQDAIASQDAENKYRKDVSNYSNAIFYKKLLADGIFASEKDLAQKLSLATSSLNDIMAFAKIPPDIVQRIPNIHQLSTAMALKIVSLVAKSTAYHQIVLALASSIGETITSPVKLEEACSRQATAHSPRGLTNAKVIKSADNKKLFTLRLNHRGMPCITIEKNYSVNIDYQEFCDYLKVYLER